MERQREPNHQKLTALRMVFKNDAYGYLLDLREQIYEGREVSDIQQRLLFSYEDIVRQIDWGGVYPQDFIMRTGGGENI